MTSPVYDHDLEPLDLRRKLRRVDYISPSSGVDPATPAASGGEADDLPGGVALSEPVMVALDELRAGDHPRLAGEVREHAMALADLDEELPPLIVHRPTMRIIDGHHRRLAAEIRGEKRAAVRFFDGSEVEAFVIAVRANVAHGMPLSTRDRVAAAGRILGYYPHLSDRAIAASVGLTAKTVAAIRRREMPLGERTRPRIGSDGRVRPISNVEGRRRAGDLLRQNPEASLREIARRVGISPGTVRDVRDRLSRGEDVVLVRRTPDTGDRRLERDAPTRTEPTLPAGTVVTMIGRLRRDPSLRMTDSGRQLLRLFELGMLPMLHMDPVVECIPDHALLMVATVARACSAGWRDLADRLEHRSRQLDAAGADAALTLAVSR